MVPHCVLRVGLGLHPNAFAVFKRTQTKERYAMGLKLGRPGAALVLAILLAPNAVAQNSGLILPPIDVSSSRIGSTGIIGTSTSVITAQDIQSSPAQNLPDILGQQVGIQVSHVLGGPTGNGDLVDLRGFGAFAQSNVLVLVNGRRYQDFDLQGFNFSSIPLNSIERVEITRGNSGAVLYGDGAIGGVINIVTKTTSPSAIAGRVEGAVGSYGFQEGRVSAASSSGPWSTSVFGNIVSSSGYRQNSELRQQNAVGNLNYKSLDWSGYVTILADSQRQNLPGGLQNLPLVYPITLADPRASVTPFDWAHQQDFNITTGFTHSLGSRLDLIVDGGVRRKYQQSQFYNYFNDPTFTFNPATAVSANYVNTVMTTSSLTPRLGSHHQLFGVPNHLLTGIDLYNTQYDSDRSQAPGTPNIHRYGIRQTTAAIYAMNTTSLSPALDISVGGRLQRNIVKADDMYNAAVDPNAGFYATNPQAPPVDTSEWQYAAHLGYDYRLSPAFALFGRVARAFRLPNADERVGAGNPFGFVAPANLNLKTQTSYDAEDGVRVTLGRFNFQSSAYVMELNNEIHFIPALFLNVNLDPTQRLGWENSATYQLSDDVRLRGGFAYTRATFREGPFAGKEVPLVSPWTGYAGLTWDIVKKFLILDVSASFWSDRRMDNDQANVQPVIPGNATMNVKIGGEYNQFFWSLAVQNIFNVAYFDYAIASAFTSGFFTAYPQPGRIFTLRAGATF
jgi:iron complex outermembrane receptor protein